MTKKISTPGVAVSTLLLHPNYGDRFDEVDNLLADTQVDKLLRNTEISLVNFRYSDPLRDDKPYPFAEGLAYIPIHGMLINRFNYFWDEYATGYQFITGLLNKALADDDVKGIVFDVNSGGGMVEGCFETSELIRNSRSIKPSMALVNYGCSAAYALASGASKVVMLPSSQAGSIGALARHTEYSKMLEQDGIKVTYIHSGKHKVDGNPTEPLSDDVKGRIQASIDGARAKFVTLVSTNMGIDEDEVYATEALVYDAEDAVAKGLAHGIMTEDKAIASFLESIENPSTDDKDELMSDQKVDKVDVKQVANDATLAERQRISAVLSSDEAKGRSELANHLALQTDMSADAAKGILAASPKAVAPAPAVATPEAKGNVATNMLATMNSDETAEVGTSKTDMEEVSEVDDMLSAQKQANGGA